MEGLFILLLVGLTSVGAYWVGAKGLGLSGGDLRRAVGRVFECVGMALVFLVGNLAAGMIIILAARAVTREFVSLYLIDDEAFVILSLLQGLAFQYWRDASVPRSS
jgi:hypothetical protein